MGAPDMWNASRGAGDKANLRARCCPCDRGVLRCEWEVSLRQGLPNSELGIERCRLSYFATKSREIMSTRTVGVGRLRHMGRIGKRYDEIASTDPSYLQWIVETSEMEEGIKHSARHWLAHVARDSR
jgi:hypothetical protein